ncbi:MAG: hypothetical protein ACLSUW_05540 [Akkermansia sp.]
MTGGLLNITLSVTGGNGNQAVNVYVNGDFFDSLSYNGNMNGNQSSVTSWINPTLHGVKFNGRMRLLLWIGLPVLPVFRFGTGLGFSGNPGPGRHDDAPPPFLTVFHQRTGQFTSRCLTKGGGLIVSYIGG